MTIINNKFTCIILYITFQISHVHVSTLNYTRMSSYFCTCHSKLNVLNVFLFSCSCKFFWKWKIENILFFKKMFMFRFYKCYHKVTSCFIFIYVIIHSCSRFWLCFEVMFVRLLNFLVLFFNNILEFFRTRHFIVINVHKRQIIIWIFILHFSIVDYRHRSRFFDLFSNSIFATFYSFYSFYSLHYWTKSRRSCCD